MLAEAKSKIVKLLFLYIHNHLLFMKLFNFFKSNKEKRDNNINYVRPYSSGALFFNYYEDGTAMSLSTIFAAVDIISNSIAELPIQVKEKKNDCNNILPDNNYITRLFNEMAISKFIAIKQVIVDMLLYGNGYIYIVRGLQEEPIGLIFLPHGSVSIDYSEQKGTVTYLYSGGIKTIPRRIQAKDMLHFYKNSVDGIHGKGILSYANRAVKIGNYTEEAAKDYFGSGCSIKGILKFNEQVMNVDKEEIRSNWNQVHGGSNGSGLAICDWNVDFVPVSQNARESQMIEARLFNVTEVARFFGISPVLLQDLSHSSYSTIEASQLEFLTHTLLPYISMIESELNRKLGSENLYIDLDEKYLMTTDKQAEASYITTLIGSGVLCINEGRKMLGLGPIEGGDKHMVNFTKIEDNIIGSQDKSDDDTEEKNTEE